MRNIRGWFADLIDPFAPAEGPPPDRLTPFMGWALRGSGGVVKLALGASVLAGISEVIGFQMIGWLIDRAQATGPEFVSTHMALILGFAAFFVLGRPMAMVLNAAFNSLALGPNLFALTLSRLNRHTLGQALSYFDDDFAGRIAQKTQQTARAITEVMTEVCNILGNALASVFAAMAVLALVDARLSAIILLWFVAYALTVRYFLPRIRLRSRARASARAAVTGQIVDTITNIATVKLFAHGEFEDSATRDALSRYRVAGIDWAGEVVAFRLVLFMLAGVLPGALVSLTLWTWAQGAATAGDIALAGMISTRLAQMTGWVSFTALGIFTRIGEIEDGMRTLSPPHRITDPEEPAEPRRIRGEISFEHVRFGYGRKVHALPDFSLHVRPGEKVALVGQSGAGKTTVVALLLRLYDVEGGKVLLDGCDVRDFSQDGLRRQIAMVRQETAMFNRSARDNIAYGRRDATDAEIEAAARKASAHEFILELEDFKGRKGYDAHLGERGVKLSGGQRQRIALARAILKNAPVLVLDEATSALDSEVEAEIQSALAEVMQGKTVIAIAHRLSTIARMDRIVVMADGRVVEQGSHAELLKRGGLYARFWTRQSGGFLNLEAAE